MIFKAASSTMKSLSSPSKFYFGAHAHKVTNVIETKNNPQKVNQLRGQ